MPRPPQIPVRKPQAAAKAVASQPQSQVAALFKQGLELHQQGQLAQARQIYEQVLAKQPTHFDALHLSGVIAAQSKNPALAVELIGKAIEINPKNAASYYNRGVALNELKRVEEAIASYDKAIAIKPDYADAYSNRGLALQELKRLEEALASYDRAIETKSDYAEAYSNRGNALKELKRLEEALASYDRAIKIKPDYATAYYNRCIALQELKRLEEALASYDRAIEIKPDYAEAYANRGNALKELKRLDEALASYDRAIEIKPDYADAYWNKSLTLLVAGEFSQGWGLYEWRWKIDTFISLKRNFPQPLWLGTEDIADKTILLHAEQGLGDTIQFCRYAKLVKALGARVILEVPKALLGLLSGLEGVDESIVKGKGLPVFDYHSPLMSLPLAFKTALESIPNKIPYIQSNISNQNKWQERIGGAGFKVAICWQGNTKGTVDVGRSFPVSLFERLAKIDGVRLISLQKNEGVEQLKSLPVGMSVETLPDDFDSGENAFLDSAAVMRCVDLVITSDTALTHLAGALGVKTWLPLQYVPDWRWMLERSDSPWYPNHRLFRQKTSDDWISVFTEMETELKYLISSESTTKQ